MLNWFRFEVILYINSRVFWFLWGKLKNLNYEFEEWKKKKKKLR